MSEEIAPHTRFQYADTEHQATTALSGIWLFLASEILFFGGLITAWMFCRHWQPAGFDAGARETVLWIGTLNLVLLITSSFVYSSGLAFTEAGNMRCLVQCCVVTMALGTLFLLLKFYEWHLDIAENLFPAGTWPVLELCRYRLDRSVSGHLSRGARMKNRHRLDTLIWLAC